MLFTYLSPKMPQERAFFYVSTIFNYTLNQQRNKISVRKTTHNSGVYWWQLWDKTNAWNNIEAIAYTRFLRKRFSTVSLARCLYIITVQCTDTKHVYSLRKKIHHEELNELNWVKYWSGIKWNKKINFLIGFPFSGCYKFRWCQKGMMTEYTQTLTLQFINTKKRKKKEIQPFFDHKIFIFALWKMISCVSK